MMEVLVVVVVPSVRCPHRRRRIPNRAALDTVTEGSVNLQIRRLLVVLVSLFWSSSSEEDASRRKALQTVTAGGVCSADERSITRRRPPHRRYVLVVVVPSLLLSLHRTPGICVHHHLACITSIAIPVRVLIFIFFMAHIQPPPTRPFG